MGVGIIMIIIYVAMCMRMAFIVQHEMVIYVEASVDKDTFKI